MMEITAVGILHTHTITTNTTGNDNYDTESNNDGNNTQDDKNNTQ
jgi:hypothetical protein